MAGQHATAEASYNEALRLAEQHGGLESERVLAPLLGLSNTLAASGHHEEAIPRLQRALAVTRAQYGLFDLRQQETLKTLAASLTAVGRVPEAQELMIYRVRTAEKTYREGSPKIIPTICDLGNWFAEVGKTPEARLTFQMALNIVGTTPSLNDPIIVEPLRGIARMYMLRPSYPEDWLRPPSPPGCSMLGPARVSSPVSDGFGNAGKPIVGTRKFNYWEGEYALQRALRILTGRSERDDAGDAHRNADPDGRLVPDQAAPGAKRCLTINAPGCSSANRRGCRAPRPRR